MPHIVPPHTFTTGVMTIGVGLPGPRLIRAELAPEPLLRRVDLTAVLPLGPPVDKVTGLVDTLPGLLLMPLEHLLELVHHRHGNSLRHNPLPTRIRAAPPPRIS